MPSTVYQYIIANTYGNNAASSWTLYVPKGSKSAYQSATGWKTFKSIIEDASLTSGNGSGNGDDNQGGGSLTGTVQGHDYVDLGLSVKWATCNVGATAPEKNGWYFQWGETTTSAIPDDYASFWGNKWRMATIEEWKELVNNCSWKYTTQNGADGLLGTAKNGQTIFLPAAGRMQGIGSIDGGFYWSSNNDPYDDKWAQYVLFDDDSYRPELREWSRRAGMSIRAVTE